MKVKLFFFLVFWLLFSCTKDKTPVPPQPQEEPTKYEKIIGTYRVYDADFKFLYDLTITHSRTVTASGYILDSLHYTDFDGQFSFSTLQSSPTNPESYYISIGYHNLLIDSLDNRWKIIFGYDSSGTFNNVFHNDTIKLIYRKTNINYWIEDAVPYLDTLIKQIAVKQH
jgi:hypothetical protein